METLTVPTKVVKMSELKNMTLPSIGFWSHKIPVKRSDNARCIYKVFKDMETTGIYIEFQKVHSRGFLGIVNTDDIRVSGGLYSLNPQRENFTTGTDEIEVIVDEKIQVFGSNSKTYHDSNLITLKGEKTTIQFKFPNDLKGIMKEIDGKFIAEYYGINFDDVKPTYFDGRYINSPTDVIESLRYFPLDFSDREQKNRYLNSLSNVKKITFELDKTKIEGISKTLSIVQPFYDELMKENIDFLSLASFKTIAESSKRTINNVKFSVIINKIFSEIKTKEAFHDKLKEISVLIEEIPGSKYDPNQDSRTFQERVMDSIPEARDIKKAALKRKSTGAINKIMDDLDFISIDKNKYPLTHEAIFSGEIPKGTFFRKNGDSYFVYNDNWEIWEEMLALHYDVAKSIAEEASRRTTYEKDIMSYFFFVLHKLPEYLEKQTGRKWKGIPKLISSENELDPPTEGSNGVAKTRSALTPIVDNEKNEVVIPYVSMQLGGYQTTYCYGLDYNVLERGMSFMGNSVTKDVEKNLNGRDDYGLMFYTLTGSHNGRGYPTFLIIFEHLDKTTKVHFHRTHPMRSKGGDYNPIHGWTIGCYKWMVGNVNFERIKAQQGDLVFVESTNSPFDYAAGAEAQSYEVSANIQTVNAYDNHVFATPVKFLPYEKKEKSNILGYFHIEKDTMLNHHEHKPRLIPAGDYELRQCRSWEANPKGIWSLRID